FSNRQSIGLNHPECIERNGSWRDKARLTQRGKRCVVRTRLAEAPLDGFAQQKIAAVLSYEGYDSYGRDAALQERLDILHRVGSGPLLCHRRQARTHG